jgi:hypothetical protein
MIELREDSDLAKRIDNVIQAVQEANIEIEFLWNGFYITDKQSGRRYELVCNDDSNEPVNTLPPIWDWKCIREE